MYKYYFIDMPETGLAAILTHCVTKELAPQAKMFDGSYLVKIEGKKPSALSKYKAYDSVTVKAEKQLREKGRL